MAKSQSFYLAQLSDAWTRGIETARKRPISEAAEKKLRAHAAQDVRDTVAALTEETGSIKSNGKARTWVDDEPVWKAWTRWYADWVSAEIERVLPEIVATVALDKEARQREWQRDSMARQARVILAERVVDTLAEGDISREQLEARLYPPNQGKGRKACRRVVASLLGLGVVGLNACRDGVPRLGLWRSLWPEDRQALAWNEGAQTGQT